MVAAIMVGLLVVAALAVDIGNVRQTQRNLQSAADAGALAGTQQIKQNPTPSATTYAADYALDSLGRPRTTNNCATAPAGEKPTASSACYPFGSNGLVYVTTPWAQNDQPTGGCDPQFCPNANTEMNVKICQTVNTTLARVINITSLRTCQSSTAAIFGSIPVPYALYALGDAQCHGINFNESGATISGAVVTNGNFVMNGSNNTLGPTFYGSGCSFSSTGSGNTYNGLNAPLQEPQAIPDPCTVTPYPPQCNPTAVTCQVNQASGNFTISTTDPNKVYCITGGSNSNITVDGINGRATFVVSGGGKINFSCGSTCNISPADAGGGFVVWQQGPSTGCTNELVTSNQSGNLTLTGTIYAPGAKVNLNSTTNLNGFIDACTMQVNGAVTGNGPITQVQNNTTPALVR
jgi:Flp pilus assembly protein TadG